ncbi:SDR family NAD(P)-dependent oxidoreductase [Antrihabitans cavernicola]|uniref:SDR family NAD(P)-dependent oxidoreductase n=1 Tax=Antrihabitans cavernicola TaxID=2495913 RepID=UPI001F39DBA1|nr:SDR family NAD(P)-dependent oxidoreductase [Spelaeibacter cavernicola]
MSVASRGRHLRAAGRVADVLNRPVPVRGTKNEESIAGKRILITGASAGIGRATAVAAAAAGAEMVLVARRESELATVRDEIRATGGEASFRACDLTDDNDLDALVSWVGAEFGGVDVLVNNAGRSIRRPITESFDRMHDFRRTMGINYFGPVQLTLGLLPAMLESGGGHIVNVGTWTVPAGTSPRFSAYHSSKMALSGFGQCLDAELSGRGVAVTTIHYPLVHTAMSSPTPEYRRLPGLTPEEAAEWILTAIRHRPVQVIPRYVPLLRALRLGGPRVVGRLLVRWG